MEVFTEEELENILKTNKKVIIKYYAIWCEDCK
jgi:thiol:disulfide interchange protein